MLKIVEGNVIIDTTFLLAATEEEITDIKKICERVYARIHKKESKAN